MSWTCHKKLANLNKFSQKERIVSKSTHEWPRVTTSDHEWPRVTTSDHEWPRVTASDHEWPRVTTSDYEWPRVRLHQNISWCHDDVIILSNKLYFTANWPFLETLIPGFNISAISDWMGEGLGDGQEGGMGGTNFPPPAPFNLGSRHFS